MTYSSEVLADAPLGYWRLGEASGTSAADSSGNGRTGTYVNGPTLGATGALIGDADNAVTFDGTNDRVDVPDVGLDAGGSFTVEAWVKSTGTPSGERVIASRWSSSGSQRWVLVVESGSGGKPRFYVRTGGSAYPSVLHSTNILDGAWHHVVAQKSSSQLLIYVDNVVSAVTELGSPFSSTGALTIGAKGDPSSFWAGQIDELAVYNSVLSSTRVAAHYAAGTTLPAASGTLSAALPSLSASLSGGIEFSGTMSAALPALGANLAGTSTIAGIAGTITATLPPLGGSLAGAYSDTATLAAILPPLSANLAGNVLPPPVTGTLAGTLPNLSASIAGQAFDPGTSGFLVGVLPALSASLSGDALGRNGLGLALDSSAVLVVDAELEPEPSVPAGTPSTVLHIVAPTVPVPTLVAGRPQ